MKKQSALRVSLKLKRIIKTLFLKGSPPIKPILPKSLMEYLFFRFTGIRLQLREVNAEVVSVCRYKGGASGALCLSIDFDLPFSKPLSTDWQKATSTLLFLAEKYLTPISWGICGVLALKEQETFEQIVNSQVPHDLGVHTFTHADLSSPDITSSMVCSELQKCVEVLGKLKKPATFIFPWNRLGHLDLLSKQGFFAFRGDKTPMLTYPVKIQKLWDVHGTYYLTEKSVREVSIILSLLNSAISYGSVLHLWSHPWDLSVGGNVELFKEDVLDPVLSYAAKKRDKGLLWVCTMRELANYSEAAESCRVNCLKQKKGQLFFSVHCKIGDERFDFPPILTLQIRIPRSWKKTRVLVDGVEQSFSPSCFLTRNWLKRYLVLTLRFEKPLFQVSLIEKEK